MKNVNVADAKARFSELVALAESGETVCITRRGKPVARIAPVEAKRKPLDVAAMRALTDSMPPQAESAGDFIRRMRDSDRY